MGGWGGFFFFFLSFLAINIGICARVRVSFVSFTFLPSCLGQQIASSCCFGHGQVSSAFRAVAKKKNDEHFQSGVEIVSRFSF